MQIVMGYQVVNKEKDELLYSGSSNLALAKIKYILDSPSQREIYKGLQKEQQKINFFLDHFIMNDSTVRMIKKLYLIDSFQKKYFLEYIDRLILDIETKSESSK